MKIRTLLLALALTTCASVNAQSYRHSKYYNPQTNRLDYSTQRHFSYCGGHYLSPYHYLALRIGPSFSTIISDKVDQRAGDIRTGINIGVLGGFSVSRIAPVFLETGLEYTQKGGRANKGYEYSYNLDYLKVPLTLKYIHSINRNLSVQPFVGGYLGGAVNGKIKDYELERTYPVFGDRGGLSGNGSGLQRFDGGLKIGCGVGYNVLYAELAYEYGLSDISKDNFGSTHNSTILLNFGINF